MHLPSLRLFVLLFSSLAAAGSFHLVGSTWNLKTPGSFASTYTSYRYDNAGNRVRETVYSPDSTGSVNGETFFEYDARGRSTRSIVLTGSDTSSVATYSRDANDRLLATTVRGAKGILKYIDSNAYQGSFLNRSWRTGATGGIVSEHRFDSLDGVSKSDSLFAPDGPNPLVPVQAVLAKLDATGRVASEALWQRSGSAWTLASTRRMAYSNQKLTSMVALEGDGAAGALIDSVRFGYDASGNRIAEDWFDSEGSPTQSWIFTWLSDPVSWALRRAPGSRLPVQIGRELSLPPDARSIRLFDAGGRLLWQRLLSGQTRVSIPAVLASGSYCASFQDGSGSSSFRLLIGN